MKDSIPSVTVDKEDPKNGIQSSGSASSLILGSSASRVKVGEEHGQTRWRNMRSGPKTVQREISEYLGRVSPVARQPTPLVGAHRHLLLTFPPRPLAPRQPFLLGAASPPSPPPPRPSTLFWKSLLPRLLRSSYQRHRHPPPPSTTPFACSLTAGARDPPAAAATATLGYLRTPARYPPARPPPRGAKTHENSPRKILAGARADDAR